MATEKDRLFGAAVGVTPYASTQQHCLSRQAGYGLEPAALERLLSKTERAGVFGVRVPGEDAGIGPPDSAGALGIVNLPKVRLRDLRHTLASVAAASGGSLSILGKQLGYTQAFTQPYSHLAAEPGRQLTQAAGRFWPKP